MDTSCHDVVFKGNHTSNAAVEGAELGKSGQGTSSPCLLSATAAGEATTVKARRSRRRRATFKALTGENLLDAQYEKRPIFLKWPHQPLVFD